MKSEEKKIEEGTTCKDFGLKSHKTVKGKIKAVCKNCPADLQNNCQETFQASLKKKKVGNAAHTSATGKYKSGRAFIIAMIEAGKYTAPEIAKLWTKEFPTAPASGYRFYLSNRLNGKTKGVVPATVDLKTGIISLLGKKKNQNNLKDLRAANKKEEKKTEPAPNSKTIKRRKKQEAAA